MKTGKVYLQSVFDRIDRAAVILKLKPYVIKELKTFAQILQIRVRVGKEHYVAYRVKHLNPYPTGYRPYKGGLRFDKNSGGDIRTIMALAAEMTLKCAVVGPDEDRRIPFGGAKGGIGVDGRALGKKQLRAIVEKFTDEMGENLGPMIDVPAPDYGTNEEVMRIICTRYCKFHSMPGSGAVVTGKPLAGGGGGCPGRREATGLGMLYVYQTMKDSGVLPKEAAAPAARVMIHGFGNVGSHFGLFAGKFGLRVVGVAESNACLYNEAGINMEELYQYYLLHKEIKGFSEAKEVGFKDLLIKDHEIDAACAKEDTIDLHWAKTTTAKIIIEGANGPCLGEAEKILLARGAKIIPDLLANAGGVTVSYFEWQQDIEGAQFSKEEVYRRLEKYMKTGAEGVVRTAEKYNTDWRTAAYVWAISYLSEAICAKHGW